MTEYNQENIEQFIPITPITQTFKDDAELVKFANENVDKVIAHNLFCLSENLNILTNLIAVIVGNIENKQKEKPKETIDEGAPWIYDRIKNKP